MTTRPFAAAAALIASAFVARAGSAQEHAHLGTVDFQSSCSAGVQSTLQAAVARLHSFDPGAVQAFSDVLAQDSTCAIATWGIASILMSNPLNGVGSPAPWAAEAQKAIALGRRIGAKTERERAYIDAVAAYYDNWSSQPERARQAARARAYAALAARYPADDEAQIFYALYLAGTQSLADQRYKEYAASAAILETQLAKHPEHPGIAHYLIHVYDAPPIAKGGLPAARRYADIAPDAAHALHMPSHIFTRVGSWKESAATNERSAAVAKHDGDVTEQMHAMDYLVYAYLQLARDDDARRVADESARVTGFSPAVPAGPYAQAATPARYAVERSDWKAAAVLVPQASAFPFAAAITHFARALGAARSGDPASAAREVDALAQLRDGLKAAQNEYWAREVEVSRLGAAAWTSLALGKGDTALSLMRSAADIEDKSEKHIVTPGRLLPARELLGELLLEVKRPADALVEFEASHAREPDRFRGLYGAGVAAEQSGDRAKARRYYGRLVEVAGEGGGRPELARARAFLASSK